MIVDTNAGSTSNADLPADLSAARQIDRHIDGQIDRKNSSLGCGAPTQQLGADERDRELFLATLGHDLRNPLAAIAAGCELVQRGTPPDDPNRAVVRRMLASVERMSRLIDQTLACARLLSEGVVLERQRCDLVELCAGSIAEIELRVSGVGIVLQAPDELVGVWDPDRLVQVLDNLISNALTHGHGGAWITLEGAEGAARLSVHNSGPTIPRELLPTLFEPFRGKSTRGLGLFIVDRIVRAHGGSLTVESSERAGTTFTVSLPRGLAD